MTAGSLGVNGATATNPTVASSGAGGAGANSGGAGGAGIGTSGTTSVGNSGAQPGGGGGGSRTSQDAGNQSGGVGGAGRIIITWTCPANAGTLTGNQYICTYGTMETTLSSTVLGGTWSSGSPLVATVNSATGVVTSVAAGTAIITYTIASSGCTTRTVTRTVYVTNAPSGAPNFSGTPSTSQCQGSMATYTINPVIGASSYIWSTSYTGWTIAPSADGLSATITFGPTAVSGNFAVKATNGCDPTGAGATPLTSSWVTISNTAAPTSVTPSMSTSICNSASLNLNATSDGNTINWYTTATGGILLGNSASGTNFSVSPSSNTTYYAETKTASGCISATRTATALITVNTSPSAPTIGTTTQPTCSTATGSVVLGSLPSGSWVLTRSPGSITTTGTGTSTTISGLAAGTTYTYSVNNFINGLKGEYFNNTMTLSGSPTLTRTDATVNFDWANGSPDPSIGNDNFSVRWSGLIQPLYSQTYTFSTSSDDGIRLWVNGVQIINNWTNHAAATDTGTIALTAGVKYDIVLEYYENSGSAVSQLSWSSPSQVSQIIPSTQLFSVSSCGSPASANVVINTQPTTPSAPTIGTTTQPTCSTATGSVDLNGLPAGNWMLTRSPGSFTTLGSGASTTIAGLAAGTTYIYSVNNLNNGLKGEYFNNMDLSGSPVLTRTDATVNFDWANGSPDPSIGNDNFSVRWSGFVQPLYSETYTFTTRSDDGIRLWINGTQLINNWNDHSAVNNTGTISLTAGVKYDIVLEYYENVGDAVSQLSWSSPSQVSQIIPSTQLFSVSTCGSPASANVVINTQPATPSVPTVGTTTQPNCSIITGSVVLSGLPTSGTINQTGTTTNSYSITGTTMTISGLAVGSYNFTASNGSCASSATANVVINAAVTNTWTTVWSNGTPNSSHALVFNGNYPLSHDTNVDVTGCSCTVNTGRNVIIKTGYNLIITNEVAVSGTGTLTFENTSSLVQTNNASINSGNIIYQRTSTSALTSDYTYWSSPVVNHNLSISPSYASGMFYSYNDFSVPEDWKKESASTAMFVGKGYIIRGPQTSSSPPPPPGLYYATFTGVPNNGIKTIAIGPTTTSNLLGNPYPSAIDADTFLSTNSALIEGTIYFWTHNTAIQLASNINNGTAGSGVHAYTSDDYASYNGTGGVAVSEGIIPTGKIAAGQAFFTTSKATGGSVTFNNIMRLAGTTIVDKTGINQQFFKTKNTTKTTNAFEKNRLWLNLTNKQGAFKQTLVGYLTDATNDYDSSFDGESFDGNEFVDFYSISLDKNLVIQGRALPFDENDEVPLGFRSTIDGSFTINIGQVDGLLANQPVFVEDKLTNTVYDLKGGDYTFNTLAGTFNDRFVLRYANKTLSANDLVSQSNQVLIFIKNKKIKINSLSETIDKVIFYDVLGRQIYQNGSINSNEFLITNLVSSDQTLIVKTTLQNGKTVVNKIIY
ncbi:T9SS sorting signal type C domain-containing protein [Flavobacterium franklandianum]|uniref:T9SS sorting signal type C domain-containing protein n=2 Tax=Flavobacterium franklandianum TaxID=2594430 RepID=A0A553CLJ8_9FLAO|nr:T9SS sorting signal type C domain-containing protein [Flavobacterium franklandianum]